MIIPNRLCSILGLGIIALVTGCAASQNNYHEAIRRECSARGLHEGSRAFNECFAKSLHRTHYIGLSNFPINKDHGWRHDLE